MLKLLCFFVVLTAMPSANGHSYHFGRCRTLEPMPEFNMDKFLGLWYAIEKTKTSMKCLTYNFTVGDEPRHYKVEQVAQQNSILSRIPLAKAYAQKYVGDVTTGDQPGLMQVKFPLNIIGKSSYIVFSTDYDNYAGIYTCQNLGLFKRLSVTILARRKTLSYKELSKLHHIMHWYDIDSDDLSIINQSDCPEVEALDVGTNETGPIDIRFAGPKEPESVEDSEFGNLDQDAEWIRM